MTTEIIRTAKGPVEYRIEGSGPAVMVLNGGHCSRTTRLSHERLAGAGFTVVTPSRPGYDATPSWVGPTAQAAADALAALLDTLAVPTVAVIGISAAGPTAIAFAQQHGQRTRALVLESAVTLPWEPALKRAARLPFGRAERLTWGTLKGALRVLPTPTMKLMLGEFTTLDANEVWRCMSADDRAFLRQMLFSMQSGTGFMNDIEHRVERLDTITAPILVLYSAHDKSVPPQHAARMAREARHSELVDVQADSHLLWIGASADDVWHRRLALLQQTADSSSSV